MPVWLQWIIGIGAGTGALVAVWQKIIRPGAKLIALGTETLPLLIEFTSQFKGKLGSLGVLEEIAAQFKTDSGSTLRDVVNRLETAANESKAAAEELRVKAQILKENVEVVKGVGKTGSCRSISPACSIRGTEHQTCGLGFQS